MQTTPGWALEKAAPIGGLLSSLVSWRRQNVPRVAMNEAMAILSWMIEHRGGPVNVGILYEEYGRSAQILRAAVAEFQRQGLIERAPSPDGRLVLLVATRSFSESIHLLYEKMEESFA